MSPEKQRIAIAEACGWAHASVEPFAHPDYLNDLNAMHEAEKVLTEEQAEMYAEYMDDFVKPCFLYNYDTPYRGIFQIMHAPAALRAEVFLRTIGKWEDEADDHP